jgi:hypothetical protein
MRIVVAIKYLFNCKTIDFEKILILLKGVEFRCGGGVLRGLSFAHESQINFGD